ncbi:MAG: hypothetical protein ACLPJJ_10700, partial [Acidocella sp.]|uniref:hypothetical protein n=1 Tax=Acidocella sp. TaxID=50710 RepID=UPI003FD72806
APKINGNRFGHACRPPSPAHILNQIKAVLGIPSDSIRWEYALGFAALSCVLLLPDVHDIKPIPRLKFFEPGRVQQILGPAPRLLVLPGQAEVASAYWQAENHFGFTNAEGLPGFPPSVVLANPTILYLNFGLKSSHLDYDMQKYCRTTKTQYVVAGPDTPPELLSLMSELGWPWRQVDDVTIFTVVN